MASLRVSNLRGRSNGESPTLPDGGVVTGVLTATSFSGNGSGLIGVASTDIGGCGNHHCWNGNCKST